MQGVQILNAAGPRASEDNQIYRDVIIIIEQVIQILTDEDRKTQTALKPSGKGKPSTPHRTVEEAVDRLIDVIATKGQNNHRQHG